MTKLRGFLATFLLCLTAIHAGSQTLKFEVATIKPNDTQRGVSGGCRGIDSGTRNSSVPLGRCVVSSARLSHALGIAFNLQGMEYLKGGPEWVMQGGERFDINGKAENPEKATEAELLQMLQNFLAERFKMKFHYETNDLRVYTLTAAPRGHKMQVASEDDISRTADAAKGGKVGVEAALVRKETPGAPLSLRLRAYNMRQLVATLMAFVGSNVVDKTELTGTYNINLDFETSDDIASALQSQAGLRLEMTKTPMQILVIDHAERPGAQ